MIILVNLLGVLFLGFIVWWFWISRPKTKRIDSDVIAIEVSNGVYTPARIEVPANQAITLIVTRKDPSSCSEYLIMESLGIHVKLTQNKAHSIELGRLKPGQYEFSCQMKMYRGTLIVVDR